MHRPVSTRIVDHVSDTGIDSESGVAIDGPALRQRRKLKGLSRSQFAELCAITPGYVSLIELNRRRPSPPVFARICDALGVPEGDRRQLLAGAA